MADEETVTPPPPTGFPTLRELIDRMGRDGVPDLIDKGYLADMATGTQFQYRQSFRSLGLTTGEDRPTQLLHDLVNANPADRPELFGKIMTARYPDLTGLPLDASNDDFFAVLRDHYGVSSDEQRRKMRTFYVGAVGYAGLPISPNIGPAKPGPGSRKRRESRQYSGPVVPSVKIATAAPATRADSGVQDVKAVPAGRYDFSLGDAGSVSVIVDVARWWDLSEDQFTKLRKLIKDAEALGDSGI